MGESKILQLPCVVYLWETLYDWAMDQSTEKHATFTVLPFHSISCGQEGAMFKSTWLTCRESREGVYYSFSLTEGHCYLFRLQIISSVYWCCARLIFDWSWYYFINIGHGIIVSFQIYGATFTQTEWYPGMSIKCWVRKWHRKKKTFQLCL